MAFSIDTVRLDGCKASRPSPRDFRVVLSSRQVPDHVDLRQHCTPVEDQGHVGSCTSNATVGAIEYQYCRRDGKAPDLSRLFVYYNARRLTGRMNEDCGAEIREAMAALIAYGVCREDLWPYDPQLFAMRPPEDAYADAQRHQLIQYARIDGSRGAIEALATGLPVVFSTSIPRRCYNEARATGVIPALTPEERQETPTSAHAMLIVGYDKPARVFTVRNSWGEEWGERGHCRIPFDIVESCSDAENFWVVANLETHSSVQLIRPGRATVPAPPLAVPAAAAHRSMAGTLREQIGSRLNADLAASSRRIEAMLSGKDAKTPVAAGRAPVPSEVSRVGWKNWQGCHFMASFPSDWTPIESVSGVDLVGPTRTDVVSFAYVTGSFMPSTHEQVRTAVMQAIGIATPRIIRESAPEATPFGTARAAEFSGNRDRRAIHGSVKVTVFDNLGNYGHSASLRMAPADRWADVSETLEAIEQSIVVLPRREPQDS